MLPLAGAGLQVAGSEAGTWMGPKDHRADEIHNNVGRRGMVGISRANAAETARHTGYIDDSQYQPLRKHSPVEFSRPVIL